MMVLSTRKLILLAVLCTSSLAVPSFPTTLPNSPLLHDHNTKFRQYDRGWSFSRLRDAIVERIWPEAKVHKAVRMRPGSSVPFDYRRRYGDDVVMRFSITTEDEARAFWEAANILYLDVWDSAANWTDVRLPRQMMSSLLSLLPKSMHFSHKPLMYDLAQAVYDTYPSNDFSQSEQALTNRELFFHDYQPLGGVTNWFRLLNSLFPDISSLITIGKSAEGREINAIRIGARKSDHDRQGPRHTVLITAGAHAREWISVSTVTYIAYVLLTRFGFPGHHDLTKFLTHYDVIIVPVLNPDGYVYTWTHDRLWRKTRQETSSPFCPGFDLDRSFPFNWDGHDEVDNPCQETYAGTRALEPVEASALESWVRNLTDSNLVYFESYLDFHSYSQKVLYPYSYSCRDAPPTLEDLEEVAMVMAKNFRLTTGHFYSVESACEGALSFHTSTATAPSSRKSTLSPHKNHRVNGDSSSHHKMDSATTGGSALDFFYHDMAIPFTYQIKLRDTGSYGFLLPKDNIIPSGKEALGAVLGLSEWLMGNRGIEPALGGSSAKSDESGLVEEIGGEMEAEGAAPAIGISVANEMGEDVEQCERIYDPDLAFDFELRRRRR